MLSIVTKEEEPKDEDEKIRFFILNYEKWYFSLVFYVKK